MKSADWVCVYKWVCNQLAKKSVGQQRLLILNQEESIITKERAVIIGVHVCVCLQ